MVERDVVCDAVEKALLSVDVNEVTSFGRSSEATPPTLHLPHFIIMQLRPNPASRTLHHRRKL